MRMAREEEAITQTFTNYVQTFQTLDPHPTFTSRVCLSSRRKCVSWQPLPMWKHCSPKSCKASRIAAMSGAS
jgi:hypothetical protein